MPNCASVTPAYDSMWLVILILFVTILAVAFTIGYVTSKNQAIPANILKTPCAKEWRTLLSQYTIHLRSYYAAVIDGANASQLATLRKRYQDSENNLIELYKKNVSNYVANEFGKLFVQNSLFGQKLAQQLKKKDKTQAQEIYDRWKENSVEISNVMGGLSWDPSVSYKLSPFASALETKSESEANAGKRGLTAAQIVERSANRDLLQRWTLSMERFETLYSERQYEAATYAFEEAYVSSQQLADLWAATFCRSSSG